MPQVALVALDPHTGEVLALVGGRNYGYSQLDHAVAKRPTGSIFKPFVYAAAINTALDGNPQTADTPVTMLDDSPDHLYLRGPDLRAAQLQERVPWLGPGALRAGHVAEQCHGEIGAAGWLRQSGRAGARRRHHFRQAHAGHGTGGLRLRLPWKWRAPTPSSPTRACRLRRSC